MRGLSKITQSKNKEDSPQLATDSEESQVPKQKAKPVLNFYEV